MEMEKKALQEDFVGHIIVPAGREWRRLVMSGLPDEKNDAATIFMRLADDGAKFMAMLIAVGKAAALQKRR